MDKARVTLRANWMTAWCQWSCKPLLRTMWSRTPVPLLLKQQSSRWKTNIDLQAHRSTYIDMLVTTEVFKHGNYPPAVAQFSSKSISFFCEQARWYWSAPHLPYHPLSNENNVQMKIMFKWSPRNTEAKWYSPSASIRSSFALSSNILTDSS